MEGIPPARDTDAEDVVWALQTAEALWKRNERGDAIVWLRRAAQAAGEANDDDRALVLAREAAELTEWFARSSSSTLNTLPPLTEGSVGGVAIDSLLRSSQVDSSEIVPISLPQSEVVPASLDIVTSEPVKAIAPAAVEAPTAPPAQTPSQPRVPSAAESHAGMLDPWSEAQESSQGKPASRRPSGSESDLAPPPGSDDGVVTSLAPPKPTAPPEAPKPTESPAVPKPPVRAPKPPLPPRTRSQELRAVAPRPREAKAAKERPPSPFADPPSTETSKSAGAATSEVAQVKALESEPPSGPLDLSKVEAFADLPDDSRDRLALDATMKVCAKGGVIESFSLAFVVSGEFHVIATGAASQATTIAKGTVLLARGTLEAPIGLRLACASVKAVIATWDAAAVEAAMGSCPWVEDELRATGDRVQALAGASLGALGERLSPDLRATIVERMSIRTFAEHETIVTEGLPVPGILLVGSGTVDLVANQVVTNHVTAGHFVLPAEALSAGPSPASARAGAGGALVFSADRKTTQELFATEPLLLELFAGW
jgi:hypothetical protein